MLDLQHSQSSMQCSLVHDPGGRRSSQDSSARAVCAHSAPERDGLMPSQIAVICNDDGALTCAKLTLTKHHVHRLNYPHNLVGYLQGDSQPQ